MDLEAGFYARVRSDATLITLLGAKPAGDPDAGDARIYEGWKPETVEPGDYPRMTYLAITDGPVGAGPGPRLGDGEVQTEIWTWEKDDLKAVDARLLELLDEATWTHDGARYSSYALGAIGWPSRHGQPRRRTRPFRIAAQSLS